MNDKQLLGRFQKFSNDIKYLGSSKKFFGILEDNVDRLNEDIKKEKKFQNNKLPKDSVFLEPLFSELIRNPDTHYKTAFNELVTATTFSSRANTLYSSTYIPNQIPCLVKFSRGESAVIGECIGCRVANAMGFDTSYNFCLKYQQGEFESFEKDSDEDYDVIVSIDIVPDGYKIEDLETIGFRELADTNIIQWLSTVDKFFVPKAKEMGLNCSKENIEKFKKDLAFQLFFRNVLCGDIDGDAKNINILYNEKGDFYLSPLLDMELMFTDEMPDGQMYEYIGSQLRTMKELYPKETAELVQKIKDFVSSEKFHDIFDNTLDIYPKNEKRLFVNHAQCIWEMDELPVYDLPKQIISPILFDFGECIDTPKLTEPNLDEYKLNNYPSFYEYE